MRALLATGFITWLPMPWDAALAQSANSGARLEYSAILNRHGVRSGLVSLETLHEYSSQPWHPTSVPTGYMTAHGRWEMQMMGDWNREYFRQRGLVSDKPGCEDASHFFFRADSIQRDIESARAIAYAMFPDCKVAIHSPTPGTPDPMFLGATSPGLVDLDLAGAAFEGRTGGDPRLILKAHATEVAIMQKILTGDGPPPQKTLLTPVPPKGDRYTHATSQLDPLNNVTDALLLEYEEGFPANETAWGRLNESNLPALMTLQEAFVDLTWDNPLIARARGSDLLAHMLRSMQQAVSGHPVEGALGNVGDRALFILGHDSDFGHFATMLSLSWILDGFPPKATPPGAAMMFEIWRDVSGQRTVRLSLVGQTIQQIHDGGVPTGNAPPQKVAVFIPGCSTAAEGFPCEWEAFRRVLEGAIDSGQVRPEPASAK